MVNETQTQESGMSNRFTAPVKRMSETRKQGLIAEVLAQEYVLVIEETIKLKSNGHGYWIEASGYNQNSFGGYETESEKVEFYPIRCNVCGFVTWYWSEGGECINCPCCGQEDCL